MFFVIGPRGRDKVSKPYEFLSRTGDGVCVVDGRQRIVLWNDAANGLLGFAADEVLGRFCYEILGGTDESGCAVCRHDCVASQAARRGESVPARNVRVRTRDSGAILVSVSTIAFPSSWHELSVLAHLFRSADARKETVSVNELAPDRIVRGGTPNAAAGSRSTGPIERLTRREHDVLRLLSTGASTEMICVRLGIAISTTRAHVRSILTKLGVRDRLEAVTFGLRAGLVEIARNDDLPPDAAQG
jgi:PAS domain S-box-containing protein